MEAVLRTAHFLGCGCLTDACCNFIESVYLPKRFQEARLLGLRSKHVACLQPERVWPHCGWPHRQPCRAEGAARLCGVCRAWSCAHVQGSVLQWQQRCWRGAHPQTVHALRWISPGCQCGQPQCRCLYLAPGSFRPPAGGQLHMLRSPHLPLVPSTGRGTSSMKAARAAASWTGHQACCRCTQPARSGTWGACTAAALATSPLAVLTHQLTSPGASDDSAERPPGHAAGARDCHGAAPGGLAGDGRGGRHRPALDRAPPGRAHAPAEGPGRCPRPPPPALPRLRRRLPAAGASADSRLSRSQSASRAGRPGWRMRHCLHSRRQACTVSPDPADGAAGCAAVCCPAAAQLQAAPQLEARPRAESGVARTVSPGSPSRCRASEHGDAALQPPARPRPGVPAWTQHSLSRLPSVHVHVSVLLPARGQRTPPCSPRSPRAAQVVDLITSFTTAAEWADAIAFSLLGRAEVGPAPGSPACPRPKLLVLALSPAPAGPGQLLQAHRTALRALQAPAAAACRLCWAPSLQQRHRLLVCPPQRFVPGCA